ncbi:carboxymuconolactone decarboxylase family protein [Microbacterium soli]|uniref:Carboxymuconolactone decarboxylase-like domain-containing protein n=1 Tax=Microbacterium soli TaxID=446075 RepID=A0ABP7NCG1_9MICO
MSDVYAKAEEIVQTYRGESGTLGKGISGQMAPEVERRKDELLWGTIWADPAIDIKTRSLCTISALMALGIEEQLLNHCRWALHLGVSREALISLASQMMVYAGLPRGHNAMRIVKEALDSAD